MEINITIMDKLKKLDRTVYPSTAKTIYVKDDPIYGGAHEYTFLGCKGYNDGETTYVLNKSQTISFIQKEDDGTIIPGLQSEQLLIALIDRHKKLDARFPSEQGQLFINKLEEALSLLEERVKERISRGVMGELKK